MEATTHSTTPPPTRQTTRFDPDERAVAIPSLGTRRGMSEEYRWSIEGAAAKLRLLSDNELAEAICNPAGSPHIKGVHYHVAAQQVARERVEADMAVPA